MEEEALEMVRFEAHAPNPLNGSQGFTRGGRFARTHARKKLRKAAKDAIALLVRLQTNPRSSLPLAFEVTRISQGTLDFWDGLPASLKPVIDGIADAFELRDDDPRFTWLPPKQRKDGRGVHAVEIRVYRPAQTAAVAS